MNIEPSVSGYIIETDVCCIKFEYIDDVSLSSIYILGTQVLTKLSDMDRYDIERDINKQMQIYLHTTSGLIVTLKLHDVWGAEGVIKIVL